MKKLNEENRDQDDNYSLNLSCVNDNIDFIDDLEESKEPSPRSVMQDVNDFDFNYGNEFEEGGSDRKKSGSGQKDKEERSVVEISKERLESVKLISKVKSSEKSTKRSKFKASLQKTINILKKNLHIMITIAGILVFYLVYFQS